MFLSLMTDNDAVDFWVCLVEEGFESDAVEQRHLLICAHACFTGMINSFLLCPEDQLARFVAKIHDVVLAASLPPRVDPLVSRGVSRGTGEADRDDGSGRGSGREEGREGDEDGKDNYDGGVYDDDDAGSDTGRDGASVAERGERGSTTTRGSTAVMARMSQIGVRHTYRRHTLDGSITSGMGSFSGFGSGLSATGSSASGPVQGGGGASGGTSDSTRGGGAVSSMGGGAGGGMPVDTAVEGGGGSEDTGNDVVFEDERYAMTAMPVRVMGEIDMDDDMTRDGGRTGGSFEEGEKKEAGEEGEEGGEYYEEGEYMVEREGEQGGQEREDDVYPDGPLGPLTSQGRDAPREEVAPEQGRSSRLGLLLLVMQRNVHTLTDVVATLEMCTS